MPFVAGYKWSEKQRDTCGFNTGVTPWNKGKTSVYSAETLALWSMQRKGKESYFKGKTHSPESIEKIREKIKNHPNRKGPKGKPWSNARREAQEARNANPYIQSKSVIISGREYHPLWHEIRKEVYKNDLYTCQECGVHCGVRGKKKIQCHHIDYNIKNNEINNLITLCASCHAKTNFKRTDWIKYFIKLRKD